MEGEGRMSMVMKELRVQKIDFFWRAGACEGVRGTQDEAKSWDHGWHGFHG